MQYQDYQPTPLYQWGKLEAIFAARRDAEFFIANPTANWRMRPFFEGVSPIVDGLTKHDAINATCTAALGYAARGWNVLLAPPGTKKSHKEAEHSDGRKWGATTDPDEIRTDWEYWPGANIGIAKGPISGFFVIDAGTMDGHGQDGLKEQARILRSKNTVAAIEALGESAQ